MTKCAIYEVDFTTKQCTNKYIGGEKVVWYRCICCQSKYAKTKSDKLLVPSISWSVEQYKRQIEYCVCRYCISDMANALGLIGDKQ